MTRTDLYLTAAAAAILHVIGMTILVTGVIVTDEVGPAVITGTATTVTGAVATLATGYRATRHYVTTKVNRAAAALVRDIVAHDRRIAAQPPDVTATVVPLDVQARRQSRESTT
ncbi:hypothetical protein [Streptomyces griseosporeus]|uniref:hypothetical protein n=1 Tax=Streptomyces griseosporeus TaxID=1910 RepID=UPI0036FA0964